MMRVAFAGNFASGLVEGVRSHLATPCDIIADSEPAIVGRLADRDVLVSLVFTREMGAVARNLKLMQVPGAGLDRIDRAALPPGAHLANVFGHEAGIAEFVLGAMLNLTRNFGRIDASLRRGVWESQFQPAHSPPPWPELAGKTLGILGYGHIGRDVARRAQAFDMQVLGIRRNVAQSAQDGLALLGGLERLDEVLRRSDYLAITLSLSSATRGLLGERELALLKPTAYLINVARADIVVEDALYRALAERRIAGAALDVWYQYPAGPEPTLPAHRPFHELPNVLLSPHVSGWTDGMMRARSRFIAENIGRVARGETPHNLIGPGE